jgi:hypothetical protein
MMSIEEAMERGGALKRWKPETWTKSDEAVVVLAAEVRRLRQLEPVFKLVSEDEAEVGR